MIPHVCGSGGGRATGVDTWSPCWYAESGSPPPWSGWRATSTISATALPCAGLRRLDVAADLWTDSAVEGLSLLECVSAAAPGAGKLAADLARFSTLRGKALPTAADDKEEGR